MTYYCSDCMVNWFSYQCEGGSCPVCGGGTRRGNDPASPEAIERHRLASGLAGVMKERYRQFANFYEKRERERHASDKTEEFDALEVLLDAPSIEAGNRCPQIKKKTKT